MAGPLLRVLILLKPNKYHRMQIAARYRIIDLLKQIADELHLSVDQLLDVSIYRRGAADRSVLYPLYGNTSSTFDQLGLASHEELFIDLSKLPSNEQLNSIEFDQSTASKGAIANEITTNNLSVHPPKKTLLGQLIRYPVPPDNSCLFSSIYFVFHSGQLDPSATKHLRNLVASKIEADPQTYSEAILGRPNSEYSKWIRRDDSWGGGIEIAILTGEYQTEICVINTECEGRIDHFGEDQQYPYRVFLLYNDLHYDPVYLVSYDVKQQKESIQTKFHRNDPEVLELVEDFVEQFRTKPNESVRSSSNTVMKKSSTNKTDGHVMQVKL